MRHITMKKGLHAILVFAIVVLLSGMAAAADVFPAVSLDSFDADTFEYVYKVVQPTDATYDFGQLWIYGEMASEVPFEWTFGAATPSPVDAWATVIVEDWEAGKDAAVWMSDANSVPKGSEWIGYFRITVPNSTPVWGANHAMTANGEATSYNYSNVDVMAPAAIPEPGSLMSFGLLAGGLIPFLRRRR